MVAQVGPQSPEIPVAVRTPPMLSGGFPVIARSKGEGVKGRSKGTHTLFMLLTLLRPPARPGPQQLPGAPHHPHPYGVALHVADSGPQIGFIQR